MKTLGEIAHEAFVKATHEEGYCTYCASWEVVNEREKRIFEAIAKAVAHSFVHMPYSEVMKVIREVK